MYSTCISCHAPLGANEMIEHFPVGRKLAFDQARGRLWAVCVVCRQWNLSPFDERWEAIEEAERLFRDTRLRASTEHVGLARMPDGTELVRVGDPQRPEFAAWRYGARFTARWRVRGPAAAVGTGLAAVTKGVPTYFLVQVALYPFLLYAGVWGIAKAIKMRRAVSPLTLPDGTRTRLTQAHIETMSLERDPDARSGWLLRVRHPAAGSSRHAFSPRDPATVFTGADATRVAAQLLPRVNRTGGRRGTVDEAVALLERAGDPDAVFRLATRFHPSSRTSKRFGRLDDLRDDGPEPDPSDFSSDFVKAPAPYRLAAEMAAHEEQERQLLHGELAALEAQWRDAEEVAAIADSLTLPASVLRQLERLRVR